jgi:hypothetical protein
MLKNEIPRIAFVYPGIAEPGVKEDFTPELGIQCDTFPCEKNVLVRFGVIGFNGVDNYSLELKIYLDDEDVTLSNHSHNNLFSYNPKWSGDGEFVAAMAVVEGFKAKAPGIYRIEASLLCMKADSDTGWKTIEVISAYFAVAEKWESKIDT